MADKVIMGNMLGMPSPRPDWNETNPLKGSFIRNKPDLSNFATKDEIGGGGGGSDARVGNLEELTTYNKENLVAAINEVSADCDSRKQEFVGLESMVFQHNDALYEMTKPPESGIRTTLVANTSYEVGTPKALSLSFPSTADNGDVIYISFLSRGEATNLTVDTTNTTDFDLVPEAHTGYEIYAKFNESIVCWVVKYSEYSIEGM